MPPALVPAGRYGIPSVWEQLHGRRWKGGRRTLSEPSLCITIDAVPGTIH